MKGYKESKDQLIEFISSNENLSIMEIIEYSRQEGLWFGLKNIHSMLVDLTKSGEIVFNETTEKFNGKNQ